MVDHHCALATQIAEGLGSAGFNVINRVVLNQVLFTADTAAETSRILQLAQASGETWFGPTVWNG
jgi:glutamate/tyrosine decarboxylase-like PLP-dependent enzyme